MKYKDLITPSVVNKLMSYAFKRDGVDLMIYKFSKALDEIFGFVDAQRKKIISGHCKITESGVAEYNSAIDADECSSEIRELLSSKIDFDLPLLAINEQDFDPENHQRPQAKEYWLTSMEIGAILHLSELLADRISDSKT